MNDVAAPVVGDPVKLGDIGGARYGAGYPAAGIDGGDAGYVRYQKARVVMMAMISVSPFLKVHDSRSLVLQDGLIRVNADIQLVTELAGLHHGASMAWIRLVGQMSRSWQ